MAINTSASPTKASTRKILEKGLANRRAATDLLTQLGNYFMVSFINATGTSTTTGFGSLLVGDVTVDLTTAAKNTTLAAITVATVGTLPYTPASADLVLVLRAVSMPQ